MDLPIAESFIYFQATSAWHTKRLLLFAYRIDVATQENTWTQVPILLILVDRQYERDRVDCTVM